MEEIGDDNWRETGGLLALESLKNNADHPSVRHMLSIERTRELMPKETRGLSDEEVTDIRDSALMLAEVAFDQWMENRKAHKEGKLD